MDNLARKLEHGPALQQVGTVARAKGSEWVVRTDASEYRARRALSCLVEPELDDEVLVACVPSGVCYILAVLERARGAPANVQLEGDLRVSLPEGRFTVAAQDGVSLVSGKDVAVVCAEVNVNAVDGNVVLQRLTYVGRFIRSEVEKIKMFASTFDSVLERWSQKVKRSYRAVEQLDQVRAERVDYRAEQTMNLHGQNTLVTAKELVKVDGEQIHLG